MMESRLASYLAFTHITAKMIIISGAVKMVLRCSLFIYLAFLFSVVAANHAM